MRRPSQVMGLNASDKHGTCQRVAVALNIAKSSRNLCHVRPPQRPAWSGQGVGLYPLTLNHSTPELGGDAHSGDFCFAKSRGSATPNPEG